MSYISVIQDSIDTSIDMKIFKNRDESSFAHIFKSKLVKIPLSTFKNVDNFNPDRLQKSAVKAYPVKDRPRCNNDISSVKYYQKQIQQKKDITPIWIIQRTILRNVSVIKQPNKTYILLDGAHRIVAHYIEEEKYIYAYLINI